MLGGVGEVQRMRESELIHSFMRSGGGGEDSGGEGDELAPSPAPDVRGSRPQRQQPPPRITRDKRENTFQAISREIKAKQELLQIALSTTKKGKRDEEIYTDKDRAAAVNMGSKDIKQSLRLKRKMEKSKALSIPEETEPGTLLALGNHELRVDNTHLALGFFNKALDLNAEHKSALGARSQCHLLLGQPQQALQDAEAALAIDASFVRGVLQKAEALYHLGDFEYSLVYFHRGLRARPEMRQFKLGVQKAQEAIENVIGDNKQVFPTSPRQLKKMIKYFKEKQGEKAPLSDVSRTNLFAKDKNKKNPAAMKRIEKHILGDLYQDKRYLEELLNNTEVLSLKQDFAHDDIAQHAQEGISYLKTRQEFWRQQKSSMPRRMRAISTSPRPPGGNEIRTGSRTGCDRGSASDTTCPPPSKQSSASKRSTPPAT